VWCSYNANGTPDQILEGVWQTHPEVVDGNTWTTSDHYEDPDHLLRRITPTPEAIPELRPIPFGGDTEELRERLARELVAEKVAEANVLDMLLAATEVVTNAIQHGGGVEEVRLGRARGDSSARSSTEARASTTPRRATSRREKESVPASGSPGS
jgi:hypothetical protein